MKKSKIIIKIQSLILIFSMISLILAGCKPKQNPSKFKPQDLVGTWNCTDEGTSERGIPLSDFGFILSQDGKITMTEKTIPLPEPFTIPNWDTDKNKEFEKYSVVLDPQNNPQLDDFEKITFDFKSTSECTLTPSYTNGTRTLNFKK